jgi:hypothetical protein
VAVGFEVTICVSSVPAVCRGGEQVWLDAANWREGIVSSRKLEGGGAFARGCSAVVRPLTVLRQRELNCLWCNQKRDELRALY